MKNKGNFFDAMSAFIRVLARRLSRKAAKKIVNPPIEKASKTPYPQLKKMTSKTLEDTGMMLPTKLLDEAEDIYSRIHDQPFADAIDFSESAAQHGIKYSPEQLKAIYNLERKIGKKQAIADEELNRTVGITGGLGASYKKGVRKTIEYISGEDTKEKETKTPSTSIDDDFANYVLWLESKKRNLKSVFDERQGE